MAGHSRWANIKHRKGTADARRSRLFTKLIKEIMVAAKLGGPNTDSNPRLRLAIQNAKGVSVPKDNIERAINKASGSDAATYTDVNYEAYAPFGVALYIECTTDNLNRIVQNIRSFLTKGSGSLGTNGSLDFIFDLKGIFRFPFPEGTDEDHLMLELIDAGAEEVDIDGTEVEVTCARDDFGSVQKKLEQLHIEPEKSGLERIPKVFKELNREEAAKVAKLIETIESDDDVKVVYHNVAFSEDIMDLFD